MVAGDVIKIICSVIWSILKAILKFSAWFYFVFIPFILQYIGIPLFVLGIILAVAFAGGTLVFIIAFAIFMYFFIKGTIFTSTP